MIVLAKLSHGVWDCYMKMCFTPRWEKYSSCNLDINLCTLIATILYTHKNIRIICV